MYFRKYSAKLLNDGSIECIRYIPSQIKDKIIDALGEELAIFPLKFKIVFFNGISSALTAKLTLWRQSKKCIVRRRFIILLKKANRDREFIF